MQLHDVNPHVINSLLCLIGIVSCLVLIGWGMLSDRREISSQAETDQSERQAPSPRPHPRSDPDRHEAARRIYRQVA